MIRFEDINLDDDRMTLKEFKAAVEHANKISDEEEEKDWRNRFNTNFWKKRDALFWTNMPLPSMDDDEFIWCYADGEWYDNMPHSDNTITNEVIRKCSIFEYVYPNGVSIYIARNADEKSIREAFDPIQEYLDGCAGRLD